MFNLENKKLKVLIVEDSPVMSEYLKFLIDADPELCVSAIAKDGIEAIEIIQRIEVDVNHVAHVELSAFARSIRW